MGLQTLLLTAPLPQAIRGEAFDRHLLGLKLQAIEDLVSMPDIFMDTSYAIAMHFNLSTSQVSAALTALGWDGTEAREAALRSETQSLGGDVTHMGHS